MSIRIARDFVRATLGTADQVDIDDAVLLTSELVTNAVCHAHSTVTLTVRSSPGCVRIEVHDDCPAVPVLFQQAEGESGRGMMVVQVVAKAWGVERHGGNGKTVWFEVGA